MVAKVGKKHLLAGAHSVVQSTKRNRRSLSILIVQVFAHNLNSQLNTVSCISSCWHFLEITCRCAALSTSWADCIPKQTWEMRWPRPLSRYCSFTMAHPIFIQCTLNVWNDFLKSWENLGRYTVCMKRLILNSRVLRRLHHYWKDFYLPEYLLLCWVISHHVQLVHGIK